MKAPSTRQLKLSSADWHDFHLVIHNDLLPTYDGNVKDLVTRLTGIRKLVYDNLVDSEFRKKN